MRTEIVTCDNCAGPIGWIPCMDQFIVRTDGIPQRIITSVSSEEMRLGKFMDLDLCGPCQCRIAIAAATKALALIAPEQVDSGDDV